MILIGLLYYTSYLHDGNYNFYFVALDNSWLRKQATHRFQDCENWDSMKGITFWGVCRVVHWKSTKLGLLLDAFFAYSLILKVVAIHSSKSFLDFYQTVPCHIPEYNILRCQCCENLRPALIRHMFKYPCMKYGSHIRCRSFIHVWSYN
jgi:hypothetical protein